MFSKVIFLLALCIYGSNAHEWGWGDCPKVAPLPELSIDKFLGPWYVIEQIDTGSKCLVLNYTRDSPTSLRVTKIRQFSALDNLGFNHTNTYTGSLDIPSADQPGLMRVKWPFNVIGKGDYVVFDTDYENYAGIYDCQKVTPYAYRYSAAILSRDQELSDIFEERIRRRLESFKVPSGGLRVVNHRECTSPDESRYNVGVDGDTFKKIFNGAADSISDAAQVISTGVQDAASYVSNGIRRLGTAETDPKTSGQIQEEPDTIRK